MKLEEIIEKWCEEENRRSGSKRWAQSVLYIGVISIALAVWQSSFTWLLPAFAASALWQLRAPPYWSIVHFKSSLGREQHVPDSLMGMIADSPEISEGVKSKIADLMRTVGQIMFFHLFEIDANEEARVRMNQASEGHGYKKILSFGAGGKVDADQR